MYHVKSTEYLQWVEALLLSVVLLTCAMNNANAREGSFAPTDYRILAAGDKFSGIRQYAAAFEIRPPRRLRSRHLEFAIGSITSATSDRAFVSFGPVWRFPFAGETAYVDFGFSPTLIGGSELNGRDLGGNFHFTSSLSIGATFGRQKSFAVSLRAQHTSNGGIASTNPGIDMIGINFSFRFSGN